LPVSIGVVATFLIHETFKKNINSPLTCLHGTPENGNWYPDHPSKGKKGRMNYGTCNSKMIMSYMSNVEMSYFGGAKLFRVRRRQDGGKGHYHDEAEGVEAVTHDS
jgi:hypothetical protein